MKTLLKYISAISLLWFLALNVHAEKMITMRINNSYDNVMVSVKEKLTQYGYKVAHIQKCDGGMESMGYESDEYKVVFFGKLNETRQLTKKYPQLIPYVPLKIAVIKENDSVIIVALNPTALKPYFKEPELHTQFERWSSDVRAIFNEIADSENFIPVKSSSVNEVRP